MRIPCNHAAKAHQRIDCDPDPPALWGGDRDFGD